MVCTRKLHFFIVYEEPVMCGCSNSHRLAQAVSGMLTACVLGLGLSGGHADDAPRSPVVVKIQDDKPTVVDSESSAPVDPVQRIRFMGQQNLNINLSGEKGQTLHLSHFPALNIDGQFVSPLMGGGRYEVTNAKLPKTPGGKDRVGFMTVFVQGDLRLTQTIELVPTKPAGPGSIQS
jgi:hypothetical protein